MSFPAFKAEDVTEAELTKVHIIGIHHVVQGCYNIKEHEVFACRSSFLIENNDNYTNSHESH
jgi:hypothetical protein